MNNADMPATPIFDSDGCPRLAGSLNQRNERETTGLTKREHLAGLAMQGLIEHAWDSETQAKKAVEMADALLRELDK